MVEVVVVVVVVVVAGWDGTKRRRDRMGGEWGPGAGPGRRSEQRWNGPGAGSSLHHPRSSQHQRAGQRRQAGGSQGSLTTLPRDPHTHDCWASPPDRGHSLSGSISDR